VEEDMLAGLVAQHALMFIHFLLYSLRHYSSIHALICAAQTEDAKRRLDSSVKSLAVAQQTAAAKEKEIKNIEAMAAKCK
jgi:hypothetical protein